MIPTKPQEMAISQLYADSETARSRLQDVREEFRRRFGTAPQAVVSVPGRIEIGGNHTDHNHGQVLAAAVNPDMIAAFAPISAPRMEVYSRQYATLFTVEYTPLTPQPEEIGTTPALMRGIVAGFQQNGLRVGGVQAVVDSGIGVGSGLSSSAAFEVLVGTMLAVLYNENSVPAEHLARIGRDAENRYFGKPCGLMDQLSCALGGLLHIDFRNPEMPRWQHVPNPLNAAGYTLGIVNTGSSHDDLTEAYAAIPREMHRVAQALGYSVLREVPFEAFRRKIPVLRQALGDRPVLRAFHFFQENQRVTQQVAALQAGEVATFLEAVQASGNSSFKYLQNVMLPTTPEHQPLALALAIAEQWTTRNGGACRVHGGGFAGTILAIIPQVKQDDFVEEFNAIFGPGSVLLPQIRDVGAVVFTPE